LNTKHAMANRTEKYDLPVFTMGDAIPKQIHQCFFGARTFTEELANNVDFIKRLNPDWTHTRYDEPMMKQFILEHYGAKILRYYERINPNYGAARADLFRYLLLYKVGGAYLDIKSTMTTSLRRRIAICWGNGTIRITWTASAGASTASSRISTAANISSGTSSARRAILFCAP
jgi:mannosyltransferase OCH1-like enzyme